MVLSPNQTTTSTMMVTATFAGVGVGGNLTLTVAASSGTWSDRGNVAISIIAPTHVFLYVLSSVGQPAQGQPTMLVNNFTNVGNLEVQITSVTVSVDFGAFSREIGPGLVLQPDQSRTFNFTIIIPSSATVGAHTLEATVNWDYYYSNQWNNGPPGTIQGSLQIQSSSPIPTIIVHILNSIEDDWVFVIVPYTALILALVMLLLRDERNKRRRADNTSLRSSSQIPVEW